VADDDEQPPAGPPPGWLPGVGERVRIVASGATGTVMRRSQTEWGLLCDVAYDDTDRRLMHASTELAPLDDV
jgi:hypothetical protein